MHRHLARDARACWRATPRGSASTSGPPRATPPRCRSRTARSTSSSATRSCTTCPTSTRRSREFHRVLRPAGGSSFAGEPSRVGDRLASWPKRAAWQAPRRCGAALMRASEAEHHGQHGDADPALETGGRRPRVRPRGPRPRTPAPAASTDVTRPRRGAAGELVRLGQPHARGDRRPRRGAVGVEAVRLPRLPRACRRSTARLLEGRLPPAIFYNLMLSARRP